MNRQPLKGNIKREREISAKERYTEAQEKYLDGEFSYDTHCLIQKLTEKGIREPHMMGVPLYKTLIEIAKILMLNELEVLFLGATLEEMKWLIIDECLGAYIKDFKALSPKLKSDDYNKKIQLSLLLVGYIVKLYLNEGDDISVFEWKIREFVTRQYDKMYQEWVERMKKHFKFSPKNMNKLFREMDVIRTKKQGELDDVNYNSKVDELLSNFVEPEVKMESSRDPPFEEYDPVNEGQQNYPQLPYASLDRRESIQSIRSLVHRDSERSDREFGGLSLKKMSSVFMQKSVDES